MRRWSLVLAVLLPASTLQAGETAVLFPFVLPWDDPSASTSNVAAWLPKPAGKLGPVNAGKDRHLYTGEQRIRFFGVNLCFAANFPPKEDAEKIAARMAKFGINVVRFHHMDMFAYPQGIRKRRQAGTSALDPEALDRLDYLIAQLKQHGIYANLNLLVSRPFSQADGLPAEIERIDWKDRHVTGFFHEPAQKTQQVYARQLLTHRNPYTRLTYAEDPAVAFVEINNENGLLHAWLAGQVEGLPEVFRQDLQRQWNAWLRKRHGTTEKLRLAWNVKEELPGAEMLANTTFARTIEPWLLEQHEKAEATAAPSDDLPAALRSLPSRPKSMRITVRQPGTEAWHIQFNQSGLKVQAGHRPYSLTFWARADKPLTMTADLGQAHDPWKSLGLGWQVKLSTQWKEHRIVFTVDAADTNARLTFTNLAQQAGTFWLAGISLRPGGVLGLGTDERLEKDSVRLFWHRRSGERTTESQGDWLRFLWETEAAYWQSMRRYVKEELKVQGVLVGTIVGCSTPNLMAPFDAVDTHAYWQHPHFPHRQWDEEDWTVGNRSMVNEGGGVLPGLALRRVLGKPHCVSEYNHSAPNTFGSEAFLLLAAYGALQDWDAIYAFDFGHGDARRITGFFDINQHPTKMATLPAAVALFVRGDVKRADKLIVAPLSREREIEALRGAHSWELVHAGDAGVSRGTALVHRVALATEGVPGATRSDSGEVKPNEAKYASDTGELLWDLSAKGRGVVTINARRSKGVIGYAGGKRFDLGGVIVEPGGTSQDGWCTLTLTTLEGSLPAGPARLLVTATGKAENTEMTWKNAQHDSVGRNWGKAPSLVEGIPATLTFPVAASRVQAWVLDESGQRRTALRVRAAAGKSSLMLDPKWKTLWYEIQLQ